MIEFIDIALVMAFKYVFMIKSSDQELFGTCRGTCNIMFCKNL